MDLSISIVSWNTRDVLDDCLRSVCETTEGIEFEVIVVDNASSDGSAEMVEGKHPQVKLIRNTENVGFSRANNRALEASCGRYFMLLNSDTICHNGALAELVRFMDSTPSAGAAGPMVLNPDGTLQFSWARFPTLLNEALGRLDRRVPRVAVTPRTAEDVAALGPFQTDWVGGCAMMVRSEAIQAVGSMDELLFMYCEETDWCKRMKNSGWETWVDPASEIVHIGGESSKKAFAGSARTLRASKSAYYCKHYGRSASTLVTLLLSAKYGLRRVLQVSRNGVADDGG